MREETILTLLKGLPSIIPIILVQSGTFETSTKSRGNKIEYYDIKKIQLAINIFERDVDVHALDREGNDDRILKATCKRGNCNTYFIR